MADQGGSDQGFLHCGQENVAEAMAGGTSLLITNSWHCNADVVPHRVQGLTRQGGERCSPEVPGRPPGRRISPLVSANPVIPTLVHGHKSL